MTDKSHMHGPHLSRRGIVGSGPCTDTDSIEVDVPSKASGFGRYNCAAPPPAQSVYLHGHAGSHRHGLQFRVHGLMTMTMNHVLVVWLDAATLDHVQQPLLPLLKSAGLALRQKCLPIAAEHE